MQIASSHLDATFAALADPTRRAILARLASGEASVNELAEPFNISQPAISKHLKVLERAGLITRGQDAQRRPRRIEPQPLAQANQWLEDYRHIWEANYQRLDALLETMQTLQPTIKTLQKEEGEIQMSSKPNLADTLTITTPSDREARMSRVFAAPRELVFRACTEPALVSQWMLGPPGWTMPVCEIDLRPGGKWHHVWRKNSGTEMGMTGTYIEVDPPVRIVSTERWGPEWPETTNTMVFTEKDGQTTLTTTILYPSKEARDAAMKTGMTDGATSSYNRLEALLHSLSI